MMDPVTQYATDVTEGRIVAGRMVTYACHRHLEDLKRQVAKGLIWKADEAQAIIDFFPAVLCLPEETNADEEVDPESSPVDGTPFALSPWQQFIAGSLVGWWDRKGYTRFRVAYIEGAKGSGKTPLGAGILLYLLVVLGDRGAQFFVAAVGKDQAKIAFADAEKMVEASPALRDLIKKTVNNLAVVSTGSFLRAISSEKRGLDGKRVSGALIDELHEHATPVVANKIRKGTKGRRNALIIETTNSGFDRTSVCWQHREYSKKVLEGTIEDDAWFAYICGLDSCEACYAKGLDFPADDCPRCDDWRVEGPHWLKANPNLGVSLSWQYLRELVRQAIGMPEAVSDLLRFNFCVWTQQLIRAINLVLWQQCQPMPTDAELVGKPCYGGLDLGQSDDFSAWVRMWDLLDGRVAVKVRFWLPRVALKKYQNRPYEMWEREGLLEVTEGLTTDYGVVEDAIKADCLRDGVLSVAYDKRFAEQMAQRLIGEGIDMIDQPQGFQLNEAIRKMGELIAEGKLCHGANKVLTWMASNYVVRQGRFRDVRPDKESAADKIDGVVALNMAQAIWVRQPVDVEPEYETQLVVLR